jgi:hypothetical protein
VRLKSTFEDGQVRPLSFTPVEWETIVGEPEAPVWTLLGDPYYGPQGGHITVLGEGGQQRRIRPARQACTAPLAPITTNRLDLRQAKLLKHPPSETERWWWSWLTGETIAANLLHPFQPGRPPCSRRFAAEDLESLQRWDILDGATPKIIHPLFKVPKGGQARLILDCRALNAALPKPGDMGLPKLHDVLDSLLRQEWMAQLDGRSYFYQFELDREARKFMGVKAVAKRGKTWTGCLKVLPMGFSYAPGIAQRTSNFILRNVEARDSETALAWVDNFLIGAATKSRLEELVGRLETACKVLRVELKPESQIGQQMDVLGLHVEVSPTKRVTPTEELRNHVKDTHDALRGTNWSARKFYQFAGTAFWIEFAVSRTPFCIYEDVLLEMQRLAMNTQGDITRWDVPYEPSDRTRAATRKLYEAAVKATYVPRAPQHENTAEVWTDASSTGVGIIIQDVLARTVNAWMGKAPPTHIYVSELMTAVVGLLAADRMGHVANLRVDNAAAVRTIFRGHSSSRAGNLVMRKLCEARLTGRHRVGWVPTTSQKADALSRGKFEYERSIQQTPETTSALRWA